MASFTEQLANFFGMKETDTSLRELFISELKGIYYAEKQFADAQPDMADAATTDVVREAFQQHRAETENQIRRLEQIFQTLGVAVDEKTCEAADGLVDDGDTVIAATDAGSLTRDAALIIAGQKVEHHEIAAYGSLHSLARLLGYHDAARLLEESLQEEKNTDKRLTEIAESFINERAKMESGDDSMRSGMHDTVREGDYGNVQTGMNYPGSSASMGVGSTGNVGYGTGSSSYSDRSSGQSSSGRYSDDDDDTYSRRQSGSQATDGGMSGV